MTLPNPVPGLIIGYSYLWRREQVQGREEGRKDRPCLIVACLAQPNGSQRVLVLPITRRTPETSEDAVELPTKVKARLGLDEARSWIVLSEWNDFVWPGPDLRRMFGRDAIEHGMLPPALFRIVRDKLLASSKRALGVARS